jgi:hypothetical protein
MTEATKPFASFDNYKQAIILELARGSVPHARAEEMVRNYGPELEALWNAGTPSMIPAHWLFLEWRERY